MDFEAYLDFLEEYWSIFAGSELKREYPIYRNVKL